MLDDDASVSENVKGDESRRYTSVGGSPGIGVDKVVVMAERWLV